MMQRRLAPNIDDVHINTRHFKQKSDACCIVSVAGAKQRRFAAEVGVVHVDLGRIQQKTEDARVGAPRQSTLARRFVSETSVGALYRSRRLTSSASPVNAAIKKGGADIIAACPILLISTLSLRFNAAKYAFRRICVSAASGGAQSPGLMITISLPSGSFLGGRFARHASSCSRCFSGSDE